MISCYTSDGHKKSVSVEGGGIAVKKENSPCFHTKIFPREEEKRRQKDQL